MTSKLPRVHEEYAVVPQSETSPFTTAVEDEPEQKRTSDVSPQPVAVLCCLISCFLGALTGVALLSQVNSWVISNHESQDVQPCSPEGPGIRREWRALTNDERQHFVDAVNCIATVPSTWRPNGTLYDDYAYLHAFIGSFSHRSASFFPWHRYTLYTWEQSLRQHCNFTGQIPYWDWTLDWHDLAHSSIWDPTTGFGGDGDPNGTITVGRGRCVVDGPFSHLRPIMYNETYHEHCLSRGFGTWNSSSQLEEFRTSVGEFPSRPFRPESIGEILRDDTYDGFIRRVEMRLHNGMHQAIGGDFLALTAANDPIFFVHHAQIDQLWWRWQQENPAKRLQEYGGNGLSHMHNTTEEASLDDMLLFGGLVPDVPVSKVMDTENGFLCYRYT